MSIHSFNTRSDNYIDEKHQDRFIPHMLEDLLAKPQDWVNINDIVKHCIKIIYDTLKS
jgi:hypothetical protein